jgi:beta-glucanase (GH16 family)
MSPRIPTAAWAVLVVALVNFPITIEAQTATNPFNPNDPPASGYTLVFDSPFNGKSLDTTKWSPYWGWGNGLSTTYPNDEALPANITFANGAANFLVTMGPTPSGRRYGSATATTYGKFAQAYGYWEAEVKMPSRAHGLWPAFWLVPADGSWPPEIDVMEWLGVQPNTDFMTLHFGAANSMSGGSFSGPDFSAGFHTLGLLWTPMSITWYIDGIQEIQVTNNIPSKPMFIVLNNDTGGWDNNIIDSSTVFPAQFSVAYVRVYSPPKIVASQ